MREIRESVASLIVPGVFMVSLTLFICYQAVRLLTSPLDNEWLFTADVAHDLRKPLAGVRLHLELLAKTNHIDVAQLVARLDLMMESVSQLLQLARAGQSFSSGHYLNVKLL